MSVFKHPSNIKTYSDRIQYRFNTPKGTVYATQTDDQDTWQIDILGNNIGLSSEDIDRIVDILMKADTNDSISI